MCLVVSHAAPLAGQDKAAPPEKVEKTEPPPANTQRDGTAMLVHYILAAIGATLVMLLICMPVRRD